LAVTLFPRANQLGFPRLQPQGPPPLDSLGPSACGRNCRSSFRRRVGPGTGGASKFEARSRFLTIYDTYHISYYVIIGFADSETERFFADGDCPARWRDIAKVAARKLDMLDAAPSLATLRSPPGNRLEALRGDRAGQFSIRVNDQWRLCFVWTEAGPDRVELVDYH
jgi:toxin HigB-1